MHLLHVCGVPCIVMVRYLRTVETVPKFSELNLLLGLSNISSVLDRHLKVKNV